MNQSINQSIKSIEQASKKASKSRVRRRKWDKHSKVAEHVNWYIKHTKTIENTTVRMHIVKRKYFKLFVLQAISTEQGNIRQSVRHDAHEKRCACATYIPCTLDVHDAHVRQCKHYSEHARRTVRYTCTPYSKHRFRMHVRAGNV